MSKRTCIAQHPYVVDVDAELDQIKAEQEEAMEQYGNAFMQKPEGGEDVDAEEDAK